MVCGDAQADVMWSELACSEASMYPTVTVLYERKSKQKGGKEEGKGVKPATDHAATLRKKKCSVQVEDRRCV